MRVNLKSITLDVTDEMRRGINADNGLSGLATREEVLTEVYIILNARRERWVEDARRAEERT
jgi:hypothetical protein